MKKVLFLLLLIPLFGISQSKQDCAVTFWAEDSKCSPPDTIYLNDLLVKGRYGRLVRYGTRLIYRKNGKWYDERGNWVKGIAYYEVSDSDDELHKWKNRFNY